jgi:gliding motility-associated-like protein
MEVSGGTNPYDFAWSNGTSDQNLYNVVAGTYSVDVTDANGCTNSFSGTIGTVSGLSGNLITRDVKCYGESTGEIEAVITNGYAPFTYTWSDGQSTPTATGLIAASYSVQIMDMYGCQITLNADVNQPDSLYIELTTSAYSGGYGVSAYNAADGYINAVAYGGISPYDYSWTGSDFESTNQNIANLSAGAYTLTVIDANGCKATATSRITEPAFLEMPNGYSPNFDGDNDNFVIHGIDAYPDNTFIVYNRWGNIVYEKNDYANEWDGNNNAGEALPDGTYFVILTVMVNGDAEKTLTGYVDLRR